MYYMNMYVKYLVMKKFIINKPQMQSDVSDLSSIKPILKQILKYVTPKTK